MIDSAMMGSSALVDAEILVEDLAISSDGDLRDCTLDIDESDLRECMEELVKDNSPSQP